MGHTNEGDHLLHVHQFETPPVRRKNGPPFSLKTLLTCLATVVLTIVSIIDHYSATTPDFDFYVMSMSFQPEFCYSKRKERNPGCLEPLPFWKANLTIHGLWPENTDGSWPASCTTEPLNHDTLAPIIQELEHYWPNVRALKPTAAHFWDFWQHEWSKHGTCSGLSQLDYFTAVLHHFVPTPSLVGQNYGGVVDQTELRQAYGSDDIVLACQGKNYLSEVRVCVKKRSNGIPTERIPCPATVLTENSCSGDKIHIAKFPDMTNVH